MLKGYEEYMDTGYDWIPQVPKTWEQRPIHSITTLSNERNGKRKDLELLSVYREFGVIKKSSRDDNHNVESQDLSNYKYVNSGYLVMNKMKMWQGSLGISQYEGIVSPAYIVCKVDQDIIGKYLHYLLRSSHFKIFYNRISYGVRVGQWDLRYNDLKNLKIYLPTSDEQNQIVRYLNAKVAKINRLISAKKKEIALLKEYKQAIITRAVTKGICAGVPMKESGVEWIGEIPEGWEERKLKYLCSINTGDKDTINRNDDGLYPFYVRSPKIEHIDTYSFDGEAVLMAGDGVGAGKVFHYVSGKFDYHQRVYNLHYFKDVCGKYIYYYLKENFWRKIEEASAKSTVDSVRLPMLLEFPVVFGQIGEQQQIVSYLDAKCSAIDATIQKRELAIEKLTAYNQSLIYECVTGKVDVRGIHVEEVPEAELIEEMDEEIVAEFDDETSEEENTE
ncbi:restriction modification system DNA specificity domain [Methanocorpusculum labreanum Z]|uniref:Restriction modification system DNA specificity domain n=1 Tax=Methanocorpusculum labreanum (strain ATCC 43576 / DSM 4855 / Z) TaxID=410358 RepID=A2SRQ7_METLZ|nr:restriction endonuclease subunit S [Methanocorpusculum labreanum]ABN07013.1 restriction modification system DNA specificity domain [Methanocorpusculum labreanum Z]